MATKSTIFDEVKRASKHATQQAKGPTLKPGPASDVIHSGGAMEACAWSEDDDKIDVQESAQFFNLIERVIDGKEALDKVKRLSFSPKLFHIEHDRKTALDRAVEARRADLVEFLIKEGSRPSRSTVSRGISHWHSDIMGKLLTSILPAERDQLGYSLGYALHAAACHGDRENFDKICRLKWQVIECQQDFRRECQRQPNGDVQYLARLKSTFADFRDQRDANGLTAADIAVLHGHPNILASNAYDGNPQLSPTLLHHAAAHIKESARITALITEYKFAVDNVQTETKVTPLMYAAGKGNFPAFEALLANGASATYACPEGRTALHTLTLNFHAQQAADYIRCFDVLVARSNVHHRDRHGATPFANAARSGFTHAIDYFLTQAERDPAAWRADLTEQGSLNRTPLHWMVEKPGVPHALLQRLLAFQYPLNARDGEGRTALMLAIRAQNCPAVETLLAAGALVNLVDHEGNTALHLACLSPFSPERGAIIQLLLAHQKTAPDCTLRNREGKRPLDYFRVFNTAQPELEKTLQELQAQQLHDKKAYGPRITTIRKMRELQELKRSLEEEKGNGPRHEEQRAKRRVAAQARIQKVREEKEVWAKKVDEQKQAADVEAKVPATAEAKRGVVASAAAPAGRLVKEEKAKPKINITPPNFLKECQTPCQFETKEALFAHFDQYEVTAEHLTDCTNPGFGKLNRCSALTIAFHQGNYWLAEWLISKGALPFQTLWNVNNVTDQLIRGFAEQEMSPEQRARASHATAMLIRSLKDHPAKFPRIWSYNVIAKAAEYACGDIIRAFIDIGCNMGIPLGSGFHYQLSYTLVILDRMLHAYTNAAQAEETLITLQELMAANQRRDIDHQALTNGNPCPRIKSYISGTPPLKLASWKAVYCGCPEYRQKFPSDMKFEDKDFAAMSDHSVKMVKLLIQHGAHVTGENAIVLWRMILLKRKDAVLMLLKAGARIEDMLAIKEFEQWMSAYPDKISALLIKVAEMNDAEILSLVLKQVKHKLNPIKMISDFTDISPKLVVLLAQEYPDCFFMNRASSTCFINLILKTRQARDILVQLLTHCPGIYEKLVDEKGNTLLHYLARGSRGYHRFNGERERFERRCEKLCPVSLDSELLTLILQQGGNINQKNNSGETPLIVAVNLERHEDSLPNADAVRLLLAEGADADAIDNEGLSAAHHVGPLCGLPEFAGVAEQLFQHGAHWRLSHHNQESPLQSFAHQTVFHFGPSSHLCKNEDARRLHDEISTWMDESEEKCDGLPAVVAHIRALEAETCQLVGDVREEAEADAVENTWAQEKAALMRAQHPSQSFQDAAQHYAGLGLLGTSENTPLLAQAQAAVRPDLALIPGLLSR